MRSTDMSAQKVACFTELAIWQVRKEGPLLAQDKADAMGPIDQGHSVVERRIPIARF